MPRRKQRKKESCPYKIRYTTDGGAQDYVCAQTEDAAFARMGLMKAQMPHWKFGVFKVIGAAPRKTSRKASRRTTRRRHRR